MILKFTIAACFLMPVFLFSQTEKDFYVSARELPEPVGGIMAIQQHVVYPESARWDSIQGTVYVEAFIDSQGNVMRTKIVRGIREDVDEAAAAAILLTKFKPGRIYGKAVNVKLVIPIRFRLTGTEVSPIKKNVDKPTVFILRGPEEMKKEIVYPRESRN
ncbi:MAG: energy transducer TonB [Ignavibacteriales bacterium]|nr:energy transducer TonB [Ignavibacteriales bacterium]